MNKALSKSIVIFFLFFKCLFSQNIPFTKEINIFVLTKINSKFSQLKFGIIFVLEQQSNTPSAVSQTKFEGRTA